MPSGGVEDFCNGGGTEDCCNGGLQWRKAFGNKTKIGNTKNKNHDSKTQTQSVQAPCAHRRAQLGTRVRAPGGAAAASSVCAPPETPTQPMCLWHRMRTPGSPR